MFFHHFQQYATIPVVDVLPVYLLTIASVNQDGQEAIAAMVIYIVNTATRTFHFVNIDYNECSNINGGCEQNCHNTVGSFYCSCNSGYSISSDGRHCKGYIL